MENKERILLCSDMDRTIIPNGAQPESPEARPLLRKLAERDELQLVYVTGRDKGLIRDAIREYGLPVPKRVIGDVGSSIYEVNGEGGELSFTAVQEWKDEISGDWNGMAGAELAEMLGGLEGVWLQEPAKQNDYKLSYYGEPSLDREALMTGIERRMDQLGIISNLIWSIDEAAEMGLLDILPRSASKLHAVRFLAGHLGYSEEEVVFAGDSGNDLNVLGSGVQSVLVANASEEVRASAMESLADKGMKERLYVARGGFLGMNGNYSAGVLEGLAHFKPDLQPWLESAIRS